MSGRLAQRIEEIKLLSASRIFRWLAGACCPSQPLAACLAGRTLLLGSRRRGVGRLRRGLRLGRIRQRGNFFRFKNLLCGHPPASSRQHCQHHDLQEPPLLIAAEFRLHIDAQHLFRRIKAVLCRIRHRKLAVRARLFRSSAAAGLRPANIRNCRKLAGPAARYRPQQQPRN
jgi:hypothetical protein